MEFVRGVLEGVREKRGREFGYCRKDFSIYFPRKSLSFRRLCYVFAKVDLTFFQEDSK